VNSLKGAAIGRGHARYAQRPRRQWSSGILQSITRSQSLYKNVVWLGGKVLGGVVVE
jgi:hypothetical protein